MKKNIPNFCMFLFVLVLFFATVTVSLPTESEAREPAKYLKEGVGGLDPETKKIVSYVAGFSLLYNLSKDPVSIRKHGTWSEWRDYYLATTHLGQRLLFLGDSLQDPNHLGKYDLLVNRPFPVCNTPDCSWGRVWEAFNNGEDPTDTWSIIHRQGARFIGNRFPAEKDIWELEFHGQTQKNGKTSWNWTTKYMPVYKYDSFSNTKQNLEELGYFVRIKQPHPLFCFKEEEKKGLCTRCNEQIIKYQKKEFEAKIEAYASVAVEASIEPLARIPFLNNLLKKLGMSAQVKAEIGADGRVKYTYTNNNVTEVSYGTQGQSWENKVIRIDRIRNISDLSCQQYDPFGVIIIRKVYQCYGIDKIKMISTVISAFLPDSTGKRIDFSNPLDEIVLTPEIIEDEEYMGLASPPKDRPALTSIQNTEQYGKALSYLIKKGLPLCMALAALQEINLSGPVD